MATSKSIQHLQHLQQMLKDEYLYEKEEFKRQTENVGIRQKIKKGECWYPAYIQRKYYNSLNQLILEIHRQENLESDHNFEYGKQVCFFESDTNENLRYSPIVATVSYAENEYMAVVVSGMQEANEIEKIERLGVQLYFDERTYQYMFEALKETMQAQDNRLAEIREILIGNQPARFKNLYPVRLPWLNQSQEAAVNKILNTQDVSIVHGPPGTGKTTTVVEAIYETLHRENQVLVCAQSNTAVDWIAEKLTDRGIHVLRIGNPTRVNEKMLSFTYEKQFENHALYPELWAIRKNIRELYTLEKTTREKNRKQIERLKEKATELELCIDRDLFNNARVVASTLVSSNHKILYRHHFTSLFIDEAAQALEPACWIAIRKTDRVILAGDHCQLPPTVKSPKALTEGLGKTLMEYMVQQKPYSVSLLKIQYRMNEAIMKFSSQWFYNGQLKAAPEVKNRNILDWEMPILWYNTTEENAVEQTTENLTGKRNPAEAQILLDYLKKYIRKISPERIQEEHIDFGIISPYKAQIQYLRKLFRNDPSIRPFLPSISINTVDGFQGQERDVIFISMVRANEEGQIGFLRDLRRMNVAMTRARMKLVIFGNIETLSKHPFYKKLIEHIEKESSH